MAEEWSDAQVASRPKETRLQKKLSEIAGREGFGSPIDWVVSEVASGVTITQMAKNVAAMELPEHPAEGFSRNWFSMIVNKLPVLEGTPSAKEQIAAARKEASYVLLDEAIGIADEPAHDNAAVQRNRLRTDVRLRTAALWNRDELGDRAGVAVKVDLGALHLNVLRHHAVIHTQTTGMLDSGEADYSVLDEETL
jgi:hypothetical protein